MYSDSLDPAFSIDGVTAYHGHVLDVLAALPEQSVSCVVTSPPYWGPRNYKGESTLWGGDPNCHHVWGDACIVTRVAGGGERPRQTKWQSGPDYDASTVSATCASCGAWSGQYGQEPTPEMYVEHSMMVFDELWRVLRDDGVLWWNLGDSSNANYRGGGPANSSQKQLSNRGTVPFMARSAPRVAGMKPKDLMLIPFTIAQAGRARGWYIRSTVIWDKPNAFPESVKDRPTDSFEYIFMFTKQQHYWYDWLAVSEPSTEVAHANTSRNLRAVWRFPTQPYPGGHFAVFPIELPRRCIAASCPAEICLRCGRPRERIVEKVTHYEGGSGRAGRSAEDLNATGKWRGGTSGKNIKRGPVIECETVGWTDCGCGAEFVPGIALDPFGGTGTTGLAARELGRDCILIECADEYLQQMYDRLTIGDAEIRRRVKAEREAKRNDPEEREIEAALTKMAGHSKVHGGFRHQVEADRAARGHYVT